MKDKGLDKGLVQDFNTSDRRSRGHFYGFRKMFWDYLTKMNVVFSDACCTDASADPLRFPMSFKDTIQYWNGTAWVAATVTDSNTIMSSYTGLGAFAGGGQGSATNTLPGYNNVTIVATAGDSVKLHGTTLVGETIIVRNSGAKSLNVFPESGYTIDGQAVDIPVSLAPGATASFMYIGGGFWKSNIQKIAVDKDVVTQITTKTTAVALDKTAGVITTVALTDAADTSFEFTFTNALIVADSVIQLTGLNSGTGVLVPTITSVAAGSCVIRVNNAGTAAFNSLVKIHFAIL